jgi:tetratricopeptide (TPR) repeat protein
VRTQAREHYGSGQFRKAAAAYERATQLNPSHAGSYAGLGASLLRLGDASGAARAYQRAIQLEPNHSGFFAALGHAYKAAGKRRPAAQAYQRALALDPSNAAARRGLQQVQ